MGAVEVTFWVNDRDGLVSYVVDVEGGTENPDDAIVAATEQAEADGYEDLNVKDIEPPE